MAEELRWSAPFNPELRSLKRMRMNVRMLNGQLFEGSAVCHKGCFPKYNYISSYIIALTN